MTSFEIATIGEGKLSQAEWLKEIAWQLAVQNDELPALRKMIAKLQEQVDKPESSQIGSQIELSRLREELRQRDHTIDAMGVLLVEYANRRGTKGFGSTDSVPSTERPQPSPPPQPSEPSPQTGSGPWRFHEWQKWPEYELRCCINCGSPEGDIESCPGGPKEGQ